MVDAVFAVAPKVLPDASFQNIANLAYALAILKHRAPPELLTKIAEAALLRMPSATSHVRTAILLEHSLSCLRQCRAAIACPATSSEFLQESPFPCIMFARLSCWWHYCIAELMMMQGVSNLLWAYAKLGSNPVGGQLFRNAVAHACSSLEKCAAPLLSMLGYTRVWQGFLIQFTL